MSLEEQLRVLQAAQGDPAKLALASVDLAYPESSEDERNAIKQSLEAAAIPHWIDEDILADLLEIPRPEATHLLDRLRPMNVVEPFPARGHGAINVHEATRLALRKRRATETVTEFHSLSARSAAWFAKSSKPAAQVEWIYHLLCADPENGAEALQGMSRDWKSNARPEDQNALAAALAELVETELVQGRARLWARLAVAWVRESRGDAARLEDVAASVREGARELSDARAEADSQALMGVVQQAKGNLSEAHAAFRDYFEISQRLAQQDPSNDGWRRDLADAYNFLGHVLWEQGNLPEAQAAYERDLEISRYLAEKDPDLPGRHRDLAVAYSTIGSVLEARGHPTKAREAIERCLGINRWLVEQDPKSSAWQRELTITLSNLGSLLQDQGDLQEAQTVLGEHLVIRERLIEQDPSNAEWQRDLAVAHGKIGDILQTRGQLTEAEASYKKYLATCRHLVARDPSNAEWQRDLAVAHSKMGDIFKARGLLEEAKAEQQADLDISRRLAERDPSNASWQRELAVTCWNIANLETEDEAYDAALPLYEEASRIFDDLAESATEFFEWTQDREAVEVDLESCRARIADQARDDQE